MSVEHSIELLATGIMFDYDAPTPDMVEVEDIARALGNTCRWGGHVTQYYSVAEHAVLVYRLVRDAGFPADVCYAALHHDSHEAYLGDVPTPLKRRYGPAWKQEFAAPIDAAICAKLGVDLELIEHDAVKAADALALAYEASKLKPSGRAALGHGAWTDVPADEVPSWAVYGYNPPVAGHRFGCFHREALRAL